MLVWKNKPAACSGLVQVLLPYLGSKADKLYKLHADQGPLGLAIRRASVQVSTWACSWTCARLPLYTHILIPYAFAY